MNDVAQIHRPVMLDRVIELLHPALDSASDNTQVVVDATLGMGGHTSRLLAEFPKLIVIGIDRDYQALDIARERLAKFADRVYLVHAIYDEIIETVNQIGFQTVNGVLFDLGVSSMQLDRPERGFAYSQDAPLDMRMDSSRGETAADIISSSSEQELRNIFHKYGEEKLAARYAAAIIQAREQGPITRSGQLVRLIQDATPVAVQRQGHPAKRVFQALRIQVNSELQVLERAIPAALEAITLGGRIVVLSYQSLEDRLVKNALQEVATSKTPLGLPVELPDAQPQFRLLVRGAELASTTEQENNPRAKPVRLRAAERVRVAA